MALDPRAFPGVTQQLRPPDDLSGGSFLLPDHIFEQGEHLVEFFLRDDRVELEILGPLEHADIRSLGDSLHLATKVAQKDILIQNDPEIAEGMCVSLFGFQGKYAMQKQMAVERILRGLGLVSA